VTTANFYVRAMTTTNSTKFPGAAQKIQVLLNSIPDDVRVMATISMGFQQLYLLTGCDAPQLVMTTDGEGGHTLVISCVHYDHPEIDLVLGIVS
jgi:hypothetical protein